MLNAAIWGIGTWGQTLVDSVQGKSNTDSIHHRHRAHT